MSEGLATLEAPGSVGSTLTETLTEKEQHVLALMADGRSNLAIAERLHVSRRTVENRIAAIYRKLGLEAGPRDHRRVLAVLVYLRSVRLPSTLDG